MGVPGLWDVLRPAGKMRSLTHLSVKDGFEANPDGKRGFRVGIDASIWFYHATYGREGENPELRTLFFRCTRLMGMPFLPLFVFDGPKRPEIKRGKRISGKNHWMVQGMQEIISAFGFEWRMAPGEAEAELAYLNRIGVIDAVLSDDVDTFLFGAKLVVRNPSASLSGNRSNPMKNAVGKDDGNHVMTYSATDIYEHDDIQLTQGGLVLVGVLRGGDYSDGLHGCGVQTAHGLAKAGFGDTLLQAARTMSRDALQAFLVEWREDIRRELKTNASGRLQRKSTALAKTISEDFPSIDVVLAYALPVTSEAKGRYHKNANVDWDKEPDLGRIAGLCELYFEWGVKEIIIKRFRTVLWPSVVLRILRHAVMLKDKDRSAKPGNGETDEEAPSATPSSMIATYLSTVVLSNGSREGSDAEEEDRLIVKIHSVREHPSTDHIREYRLEIAPAQLVRQCEAGIKGLRTALPPDLTDDEEEDDEDDEGAGPGKRKGRKGKKAPPDPESHLRLWLPACMVDMVDPEMVDEFEGVQRWKAEKKAAKGNKAARQGKVAATKKGLIIAEEEENLAEDEVLRIAPKVAPNAGGSASVEVIAKTSQAKTSTRKQPAPPKIDNFFTARKLTNTVTTSKRAKTTTASSTSRVADLFKAFSSDSDELDSVARRTQQPFRKSPPTRLTTRSSSSRAPGASSSRIISLLDAQPRSCSSSPPSLSQTSAPLPSKARTPQPFPMDFDVYPLNKHPTVDEDVLTTGAGPSSSRARPRSSLSTSESDSGGPSTFAIHKHRKSGNLSSTSTLRKNQTLQRGALRREEEEKSSDSALESRMPSPSHYQSGPTPTLETERTLARREEEEDLNGVTSLPRPRRKIISVPTSSKPAAYKPPRPLPADLTIISVSSGSEPDSPPPKPVTKAAAPLQRAKTQINIASTGDPIRRACDPLDIIDLT